MDWVWLSEKEELRRRLLRWEICARLKIRLHFGTVYIDSVNQAQFVKTRKAAFVCQLANNSFISYSKFNLREEILAFTSIVSGFTDLKRGAKTAVQLNISLAQSSGRRLRLINEPKVWRLRSEIASILRTLKREKCQLFHLLSDSSCHCWELMSAFGDLWRFSLHIKCRLWNTDTWKSSRHSRAGCKERSEHGKTGKHAHFRSPGAL